MQPIQDKPFRFQNMEIWQRASDLSCEIDDVADELEQLRRYKYAEQLRSAGLSISNNIAERSGCDTTPEFRRFLGYARRSAFETASMLLKFDRCRLLETEVAQRLIVELHEVCRRIVGFSRSLG
jgi:four helix bundle protein